MINQKNKINDPNDVEHGNITMNQVIDAVKVGVPVVAGFAFALIRGVPKIIKFIKR